jgi:hypothetical protein
LPRQRFPDVWPGPFIDQALATSERRRRDAARLREDAKALLAVNFRDLVFGPLLAGGRVLPEEVSEVVERDIETLVVEAQPELTGRVGPEISGHAIIDSLSRNWRNLGLSRFNLWEHTDE